MAWIELHTVLIRHRKTKRMARELLIRPVEVVGYLVTLWTSVMELAEEGDVTKWSNGEIADYAEYQGGADIFVGALLASGWIDEKDGRRLIHDWWDYAGRYLKAKYKTSNPEKLQYIMSLYGKARPPLGSLKTDFSTPKDSPPTVPTVPTVPNQDNHTKDIVDKKRMDQIIEAFISLKKYPVTREDGTKDVALLSGLYKRNARSIKSLLVIANGNVIQVIEAMNWFGGICDKKGLSWTLETIEKWFPEFLVKGKTSSYDNLLNQFGIRKG